MKRIVTSELLDSDAGTPVEVASSLADLRHINRLFGGVATTEAMISRVAEQSHTGSFSLLEVASGAGDVPRIVRQRLQRRGLQVEVILLDRAASHLKDGNDRSLGNGNQAVVGDALALPFRDASFDLVSCSLFVHHLSPEETVRFANEGLRVCRTALLINDLVRNWMHLALTYAGMPLFRSRITRNDSVASVRQAYTPDEMRSVLQRTSAAKVEIERHYLYRMGVVAWKTA